MHPHGPSDFIGPQRGTPAWWHGGHDDAEANAAARPQGSEQAMNDRPIRHELVERVRREIAAGAYDTPEKWGAALDRLLDRLERP